MSLRNTAFVGVTIEVGLLEWMIDSAIIYRRSAHGREGAERICSNGVSKYCSSFDRMIRQGKRKN